MTDAMKRLTISSKTYTQTVAALRKWGMSTIVTLIAFTRIGIVNTKLAYAFVVPHPVDWTPDRSI